MKKRNTIFIPIIVSMCAAVAAQANVFNLFSNAGDQGVFGGGGTAETTPIPDPLEGSGWGVMSDSGLDGDALRFWDTDSSRATLRFHATFDSGVQFNFDGLIESGAPEGSQNLWRLGSPTASLAGGLQAVVNARLTYDGRIAFGSGNTVYDSVDVGVDTPFSVNLVINAAAEGGDSITYDQDGTMVSLLPQHFAMYVNNTLIGSYEAEIKTTAGIGRTWFLTGVAAADPGPTMQIDNYEVRTGDSISAIPEPKSYAIIAAIVGLGLVLLRRRR